MSLFLMQIIAHKTNFLFMYSVIAYKLKQQQQQQRKTLGCTKCKYFTHKENNFLVGTHEHKITSYMQKHEQNIFIKK